MKKQIFLKLSILIFLFHVLVVTHAQSDTTNFTQSDTIGLSQIPAGSFKWHYDHQKPPVVFHYSYNIKTQTHDYSGNWDFDGDGETDKIYFIITDAAKRGGQLYFYLRIVLSADKKIRNFPFLQIDMPVVEGINELKKVSFYPPPLFPKLVVDNFHDLHQELGNNLADKLYLRLDEHWIIIPSEWKKLGVSSTYLLLYYEKGGIKIKNFFN